MKITSAVLAVVGLLFLGSGQGWAEQPISIRVAAWNLEGNGQASMSLLRQQLADKQGVDLWGLCEVHKNRFEGYRQAAAEGEGSEFEIIEGTTGGPKLRLAIIYDTSVLELVGEPEELHFIAVSSGLRAPLVARFRGKQTGQEFLFMVNHLKCCSAGLAKRVQQCRLINSWAAAQDLPVIMCGDLNAGYDVALGAAGEEFRDDGYDVLVDDGPFVWLQPDHLAKTQANDGFNTVIDYIMVANAEPIMEKWSFRARILERDGDDPIEPGDPNDFDDDNESTDHRPVDVWITFNQDVVDEGVLATDEESAPEETGEVSVEQLSRRIDRLERLIERLLDERED